jgi:DNA ligase-1
MKQFCELLRQLDSYNRQDRKLLCFSEYLANVSPACASLAVALLLEMQICKLISSKDLKKSVVGSLGMPAWLFEESYKTVGDLAETVALLFDNNNLGPARENLDQLIAKIRGKQDSDLQAKKEFILSELSSQDFWERFVFIKIIVTSSKFGVSKNLIIKACAQHFKIPETAVATRLESSWDPFSISLEKRLTLSRPQIDSSTPYPFLLGHELDCGVEELGSPQNYIAEYKWNGIRAQVIKREGQLFIWGRDERLLTEFFPDVVEEIQTLADATVLDGEIIAFNKVHNPINLLESRLVKVRPLAKLHKDEICCFIAFDLLELNGQDFRGRPLSERRSVLESIPTIRVSESLQADSWEHLYQQRSLAREFGAEGLMLKSKNSIYALGRKKNLWWKWKLDPYSVDAVLIYAQKGTGKRANLYADYTFAVWKDATLVPLAKTDLGLDDRELIEIDKFVKSNTKEKFGPVRSVKPELVFEIAFEGIETSKRNKSGVQIRAPKIVRRRRDKNTTEVDSLESIIAMTKMRTPYL